MTRFENEIAVQLYLHSRETELGYFILSLIRSKAINRAYGAKHRIWFGSYNMTPQEELFAKFFNEEREYIAVNNMDLRELKAHREELQKIAFEARAKLTSADNEIRDREAKTLKTAGFKTNLTSDDISSEAINKVKQRQAKMSAQDKLLDSLMKIKGMDMETAQGILSARNLKEVTLESGSLKRDNFRTDELKSPVTKPIDGIKVNPFAKPVVTQPQKTEVIINEESNTVIVKTEEPKPEVKKNPFQR